ncbi:hypothetical protein VULLAG_LOCUS17552 [Vulpes lagopus]
MTVQALRGLATLHAHPRVSRGPLCWAAPRGPPRPKRAEPAQQVVGGWKAPRLPRLPRGRPGQQRKAPAPQVAGAGVGRTLAAARTPGSAPCQRPRARPVPCKDARSWVPAASWPSAPFPPGRSGREGGREGGRRWGPAGRRAQVESGAGRAPGAEAAAARAWAPRPRGPALGIGVPSRYGGGAAGPGRPGSAGCGGGRGQGAAGPSEPA